MKNKKRIPIYCSNFWRVTVTVTANSMIPDGRVDAVRMFPVVCSPDDHPASAATRLFHSTCKKVQDAGWGIADAVVTMEASGDGKTWNEVKRTGWKLSSGAAVLSALNS